MFYIIHKLNLGGWFSLGSSSLLLLCRKLKFEDPDRYEFDLYLRKNLYPKLDMNSTVDTVYSLCTALFLVRSSIRTLIFDLLM